MEAGELAWQGSWRRLEDPVQVSGVAEEEQGDQ